jgi:uncharacterized protein YbjT (DUF2867 family)
MTIVITGATGALNGATLDHLLVSHDPGDIIVVSRDAEAAKPFAEARSVGVREGDYARPATLPTAFEGADQLLLVSSNDPAADAQALHRAAVDAAVEVGVGRILYTSHQGAAPDTPFGPGRDHAATEEMLERSGLPWTSLRNGFYLHSLGWLLGPWREEGVIRVPADGAVSWTSRHDAALAAAHIIDSDGRYDGRVTLTAPDAPTFEQVARTSAEVAGRSISFEVIGDDVWLAEQVAAGRPEPVARFTLGMFHAARDGFFAGTDPLLSELLGRAPRSVRDELQDPTGH